jgi:hypothetical protein
MWPELHPIPSAIYKKIISRKTTQASRLDCWIRVISGAVTEKGSGLIMESNQDATIFRRGGKMSIYGDAQSSGDIGTTLDLKAVGTGAGRALRPSPIITSFEVKEGIDQISREATIQLKCFTLPQMELLQSYLMEPGYSLCVEWGWNTPLAGVQALNMKAGTDTIINAASNYNLDQEKLTSKRIASKGDYDSFLGFIVGGNVKSVGDAYEIEVRLKGAPSLPTFLQSQHKILKLEDNQSTKQTEGPIPYGPSELEDESEDSGAVARDRRFKNMFNDLPSFRQTEQVRLSKDRTTMYDFINFDAVVNKSISSYTDPTIWRIFGDILQGNDSGKTADVKGATIEKEKLFSKNRYIRFETAINILNQNDSYLAYKIGNKDVSVQISVRDVKIGAFPKMFSMKATKLIIPGELPDFAVYFLNTEDVIQSAGGMLNNLTPTDNSVGGAISFVQNTSLNHKTHGFTEDAGNWGLLQNLYLNFDVFKEKIQEKNKTIRDVLENILNEMSSAVNSFWNFQIHEKSVTDANGGQRYILSVYDENWIGYPETKKLPAFVHSGEASVFLDANLDISISQEMTNQIINKRLAFAVNPDAAPLSVGRLFNSNNDLFLKGVTDINGNQTNAKPAEADAPKKDTAGGPPTKLDNLKGEWVAKEDAFNKNNDAYKIKLGFGQAPPTDAEIAENARLSRENQAAKKAYTDEATKQGVNVDAGATAKSETEKEATTKLSYNLSKIDVVPNPRMYRMGDVKTENIQTKEQFDEKFQVYCFDDAAYFDRLKNDAFSAKGGLGSLSHPLPIKYSFTILGCSGITRGDIFYVLGIPKQYADHGVWQVTQVEHTITNMTWKTQIEALYRQVN